jgi:hypothetical protein
MTIFAPRVTPFTSAGAVPRYVIGAAFAWQGRPLARHHLQERDVRQHRKAKAIAMAQDSRLQFVINAAGVLTVLLLAAMVEVAALQHFDAGFQLDAAQLQASHPALQHVIAR